MSSKPSPEGVAEVVALLREAAVLDAGIADLHNKVIALKAMEERRGEVFRAIGKALQDMDVHSAGNNGWAGRTEWFLGELRRQVLREPPGGKGGGK